MSKKNPWVLSLSLAALVLAPGLHAAESAEKEAVKSEPVKSETAKSEPAADTAKAEKAEEKPIAKGEPKKASSGHKSQAIAGGLAFFPGIAVHGAGHMYAGSWMKGFGLLAIEGAGIVGLTQSVGGLTDASKVFSGGKSVPTDVSGVYTNVGLAVVSSMALMWTWFDDMAGAPVAVAEYNKIQDQNSTAQFRVSPRGDGAELALSTNF